MNQFDLIVIGAGPGGYVAAIRAVQLGLSVACIEKEASLGGTCLRVGCIPSKALLESSALYAKTQNDLSKRGIDVEGVRLDLHKMLEHKDRVVGALTGGVNALFKKNGIQRYTGHARIDGPGRGVVENSQETIELEGRYILIATGSSPATLPGLELDGNRICTSTEALAFDEVPGHLVVIRAGYIGLEMGIVWNRLGARVTVLEYLGRILPGTDAEIAAEAQNIFKKLRSRVSAGLPRRRRKGGCRRMPADAAWN